MQCKRLLIFCAQYSILSDPHPHVVSTAPRSPSLTANQPWPTTTPAPLEHPRPPVPLSLPIHRRPTPARYAPHPAAQAHKRPFPKVSRHSDSAIPAAPPVGSTTGSPADAPHKPPCPAHVRL